MWPLALLILAQPPALHGARPELRVELVSLAPPRTCPGTLVEAPAVQTSGRLPGRFVGPRCEGWGWVTVRAYAPAAVLTRNVERNQPLEGAFAVEEIELTRALMPLREVPAGATATRKLLARSTLTPEQLHVGPPAGAPITVRYAIAGITLEQRGTVVPCTQAPLCASLPNGKHLEGTWTDGVLLVGGGS
jgi:hypothetical protein